MENDGRRSSFSNYGDAIDISAPGSSVLSTIIDGYGYLSRTSMACPHVSGVLALGFSVNPGLSNDAALGCLYSTALDVESLNPGYENYLGAGMVDAYAFVECAVAGTLPPTSMPVDPSLVSCDFERADLCGWTTGNGEGKAWTRITGFTPSWRTGPSYGDGYYMYVEAPPEYFAGPFLLTSPRFDSGGAALTISFDFHMWEADMGIMSIQYFDGQNWINLRTLAGNQGNSWHRLHNFPIPSTATRVRFSAFTGNHDESDICIDNVALHVISSPPTLLPTPSPTGIPTSSPTYPPTPSPMYTPTFPTA